MNTNEQIIANFLRPPGEGGAYTDEKLAALLAHAEDGKLAYFSCCCFAGLPTARHALRSHNPATLHDELQAGHGSHDVDLWMRMSDAFGLLAKDDDLRRGALIPLIKSEMKRRESSRAQVEECEVVTV